MAYNLTLIQGNDLRVASTPERPSTSEMYLFHTGSFLLLNVSPVLCSRNVLKMSGLFGSQWPEDGRKNQMQLRSIANSSLVLWSRPWSTQLQDKLPTTIRVICWNMQSHRYKNNSSLVGRRVKLQGCSEKQYVTRHLFRMKKMKSNFLTPLKWGLGLNYDPKWENS